MSGGRGAASLGSILLSVATATVSATTVVAQPVLSALPASQTAQRAGLRSSIAVSRGGQVIAFESDAALVEQDTNETTDIYLLDRVTGILALASRTPDGRAADGPSVHPSISDDGRMVAFESGAGNLLAAGTRHGAQNVYVLDRATFTLVLVSAAPAGGAADGESGTPQISANGRFVVFNSNARNLLPAPCEGPTGVQAYRFDLERRLTEPVGQACGDGVTGVTFPTISGDGMSVVAVRRPRDGSGHPELWHYDFAHDTVFRVVSAHDGRSPDGPSSSPALSGNGLWLAFASRATNLLPHAVKDGDTHVYLRRLPDGPTLLLSANDAGGAANGTSTLPAIDEEGLRVVFQSTASDLRCAPERRHQCGDINLVADIFLWQLDGGGLTRISAPAGATWLDASLAPVISSDGGTIAFLSKHPVDEEDGRASLDVFIADHGRCSTAQRPPRGTPCTW